MKKKGKITGQIFFGSVKVSDKGQIAIPVDLRNELKINKGDQLLIGKRKDGKGLVLLKMDVVEELFNLQEDIFSS